MPTLVLLELLQLRVKMLQWLLCEKILGWTKGGAGNTQLGLFAHFLFALANTWALA